MKKKDSKCVKCKKQFTKYEAVQLDGDCDVCGGVIVHKDYERK